MIISISLLTNEGWVRGGVNCYKGKTIAERRAGGAELTHEPREGVREGLGDHTRGTSGGGDPLH